MDIVAKIPPLPKGKTKHFFVSYNSLDRERVYSVVDELEKRFGLHCVFDERDFQGGKDISVNILEGIKFSLKVLIFLTPNFLGSGWCKYETDAAFVTSMGRGYSCIVPVVLDECEIPPTLVTLTYIDATVPGTDVPAKIASTLLRPESDDGLFPLNISTFNKIFENGYCFIIPAKRENLCAFRPAKYYFKVDENLLGKLKENKVEVPEQLLVDAMTILNDDSVMWSYDFLNRCRNLCVWSVILVPLYFLIYMMVPIIETIAIATRNRNMKSTDDMIFVNVMMYFCMPVSFILFQILLCFVPNMCHRKKLHVMRYNIARCKEYFVGIVKSRHLVPVDRTLTPEKYADTLIDRHLSQIASTLVDDFDFLPDAPYNRHNVKKGKMCICQQLENNL